jgi:hypothetical protein
MWERDPWLSGKRALQPMHSKRKGPEAGLCRCAQEPARRSM